MSEKSTNISSDSWLPELWNLYAAAECNLADDVLAAIGHLGGYVNVARPEDGGQTPLHKALNIAASENQEDSHFETIEVLLNNGAAEFINVQDEDGNTLLHRMSKSVNPKTVEVLLKKGADVHIKNHKYGFQDGVVPLCSAVDRENIEIVQLLLEYGSDANSTDWFGRTLLQSVTKSYRYYIYDDCLRLRKKKVKILQLLLKFGADVNVKDRYDDKEIPLFDAIRNRNVAIVQMLVDHGSKVNRKNKNGTTPLKLAAFDFMNLKIVKCLVKTGAYGNFLCFKIRTPPPYWDDDAIPFHREGFEKILLFLLKYSDINIMNEKNKKNFNLNFQFDCKRDWQICLEHIAKLKALDLPINPSILETIEKQDEYSDYFDKCLKELTAAKNTKIKTCWVTFFNLLVDSRKKIKNYAGNYSLIEEFLKSDFVDKFSIYGPSMKKNVKKGFKRRLLFDKSVLMLSNKWPIFNPTHLIITDIFDCLSTKDLLNFSTRKEGCNERNGVCIEKSMLLLKIKN